jgi:hypothetical protein
MKIHELVDLTNSMAQNGGAVNEQLWDVVIEGEPLKDQNLNALEMISDWLGDAAFFGVEGARAEQERIDVYLAKRKLIEEGLLEDDEQEEED